MSSNSFPYLSQLMSAYFHQDCYSEGETDEDILREYKKTKWEHDLLGVRADIKKFLHEHTDNLLAEFNKELSPDIVIGENDDEARDWLLRVEKFLAS